MATNGPIATEVASVRRARIEDADAIGALHVRSWQAVYAGLIPAPVLDRLSPARRATFWRDAIAHQVARPGAGRTWVVELDGRVVGFAATGRARDADLPRDSGEIHSIYLAPEAWSRGVGGRLFDEAVDDLAAAGLDPIVLWVIETNERAVVFYERRGWQPDGMRRTLDFDGLPVEEARYRRVTPGRDR